MIDMTAITYAAKNCDDGAVKIRGIKTEDNTGLDGDGTLTKSVVTSSSR